VAGAARVLAADGLFCFTAETHEGAGVLLRQTLRYAHAAGYLREVLARSGLAPLLLEPASTRTEKGVPVSGLLVVAAHAAAA
jgi:predicted TPR repeat methyltransferase